MQGSLFFTAALWAISEGTITKCSSAPYAHTPSHDRHQGSGPGHTGSISSHKPMPVLPSSHTRNCYCALECLCLRGNVYPAALGVKNHGADVPPQDLRRSPTHIVTQTRVLRDLATVTQSPGLGTWLSWRSACLACRKPWIPSHSWTA